jgi:hypothetical protein
MTTNHPTRIEFSALDTLSGLSSGTAFKVNEDTGVMTVNMHHPFGQMWFKAIEDGRRWEMEVFMMCIGGFMTDMAKHQFPNLNGDIWCPYDFSEKIRRALEYLDKNDPAAEERRVNKEIKENEHEARLEEISYREERSVQGKSNGYSMDKTVSLRKNR